MKRIALVALAMALISAACGANASAAPGSAAERDPIRPNRMFPPVIPSACPRRNELKRRAMVRLLQEP